MAYQNWLLGSWEGSLSNALFFCGGEGEGFFSLPVPYNSSFLEAVMAGTHAGEEPCR